MDGEAADPVAWLRAQIEARLKLAREASAPTDGHWWRRMADAGHVDDGTLEPVGALYAGEPLLDVDGDVCGGEEIVVYDEGRPSDVQFEHIAGNDPQDTIARCEAELAILDAHKPVWEGGWQECGECGPNNDSSGILAIPRDGDVWWPCRTFRLILGAYRFRSGYDEKWGTLA